MFFSGCVVVVQPEPITVTGPRPTVSHFLLLYSIFVSNKLTHESSIEKSVMNFVMSVVDTCIFLQNNLNNFLGCRKSNSSAFILSY